MKRDINTGEIIEFREVMNETDTESQSTIFFNRHDSRGKSKLDTGTFLIDI